MACGLCQVHRQARRLPRDVRAGRHAPPERPLRRQARPGQPVLAITGQQFHDLIDTFTQQDVDLTRVFNDVARLQRAGHGTRRTSRTSRAWPAARRWRSAGVAHINVPGRRPGADARRRTDARSATCRGTPPTVARAAGRLPARRGPRCGRRDPERRQEGGDPRRAAARSARGRRARAHSPSCSARRSSRRCSARRCVPDDVRYTTGGIGLLGTRPSQEAMERLRHAVHGRHRRSPTSSSTRSPARRAASRSTSTPADRPALPGRGRPGRRLPARRCELLPLLERKDDRGFLEKAQEGMQDWREMMDERGTQHRQADEAAGGRAELGRPAAGRRHRLLRLRARSRPGRRGTSPCATAR